MNVLNSIQSGLSDSFSRSEPVFIDLGSSKTRIYVGSKLLFSQATCIAVHTSSDSVVAYGDTALRLLGKTPKAVSVCFPVQNGSISHSRYLGLFVSAVVTQVFKTSKIQRYIFGMHAVVGVPTGLSPAKKNLLEVALRSAGFTKVTFKSIGLLFDVEGCVIDLGAQKTEVSVVSQQEVIETKLIKWGGIDLTELLQKVVREKYHCVLGWHVAEKTKLEVGTLLTTKNKVAIQGKDLSTQSSKTVIVKSSDIQESFSLQVSEILDQVQYVFSLLPSEIIIDILQKGIYLTGGTSQLEGLNTAFMERFHCEVIVSKRPQADVSIGLQRSVSQTK